RGRTHASRWAKLYRGTQSHPEVVTDLRIEPLSSAARDAFAALLAEVFGWSETLSPWVAAPVGRDAWHHYGAFDRDQLVAAAAMRVHDRVAWFGMAATRASHRGRGAQSALIARRSRDAAALGCDLLVVETAEDTPEKPAPSYHN